MDDLIILEHPDEASEILQPIRLDILSRLGEPRTCTEIAKELGITTQKVNYHMNVLRDAGFVRLVDERRKRGTIEGIYEAAAKSIWFSPRIMGSRKDRRRITDQASLGYLLNLSEDLQEDVGDLSHIARDREVSSFGVDARVELRDSAERSAFLSEVEEFFHGLAERYGSVSDEGAPSGEKFRLMVACYEHYDRENNPAK